MNSKLIILVLLTLSLKNYAQLRKGRKFLGGNVNYSQNTSNSNDSLYNPEKTSNEYSTFQLNLNVGYFISDHLAIGIIGSFLKYKSNYENGDQTSVYFTTTSNIQNSYSGGIFVRYYQMIKESKFGLFAQLNGSYGIGDSEYKYTQRFSTNPTTETTRKTELNVISFGLSPGVVFFINDHFGIESSLGLFNYSKQNDTYETQGKNSGTGVNSSLTAKFSISALFLGINYYF